MPKERGQQAKHLLSSSRMGLLASRAKEADGKQAGLLGKGRTTQRASRERRPSARGQHQESVEGVSRKQPLWVPGRGPAT